MSPVTLLLANSTGLVSAVWNARPKLEEGVRWWARRWVIQTASSITAAPRTTIASRTVRFIIAKTGMRFDCAFATTVMEAQLENVQKELLTKTAEESRDSAVARARLKNGLSQLANQARSLARRDATELVQRFGELGRRKFNLAA